MITDLFQFTQLTQSTAAVAARLALPQMVMRVDTVAGQLQSLTNLNIRWSCCVAELRAAGWEKLLTDSNFYCLSNCYPTTATIAIANRARGYFCRQRLICPWCYSRRVMQLYRRLQVLWSPAYKLLSATKTVLAPMPAVTSIRHLLLEHRQQLHEQLKRILRRTTSAYWSLTIEPALKTADLHHWQLVYRVLAFLPVPAEYGLLPASWQTQIVPTFDENLLTAAVGRVLRYPEGLLRGPTDQVVAILRACQRLRLSENSGALRQTTREAGENND